MTKPIIEIKNLSKEYIISHNVQPYYTLRDSFGQLLKKPFKYLGWQNSSQKEKFLALNDVDFSVMPGEAIGIIGRNGAGKSTLLKILSQITPPSKGSIHLRGRVASLLEVGTGFHPELTGRENIFLNGAILGMTRKEIVRKFDEIVAFAGVEKFLDTPVKRYSSGMYVRLAFAVAAHLDPEILIIDEVLAVGDAEFQQKCLGKMGDIAKSGGRTVLFVSHNIEAVKKLCTRCLLLDSGKKIFEGGTDETLQQYEKVQSKRELKINKGEYNDNRRGSGTMSFTSIEILDTNNKPKKIFHIGDTVRFKLDYSVYEQMEGLYVIISFYLNRSYGVLTSMKHEIKSGLVKKDEKGCAVVDVKLTSICPRNYLLHFWLGDKKALHQGTPQNYDVVDNMTDHLIVKAKSEEEKEMAGYFTLPSNIDIL